MDPVENQQATAEELVTFARQKGLDLGPLRNDSFFDADRRWIFFWRKRAALPCTGRADEEEGTLHYNMQGDISVLPRFLEGSASAFRGGWSEAGTFENIDQAFELLKAWLVDRNEIDDLPQRRVRRSGIG